ncbi:unnamed protein product [Closterium sp. NIES-64]|nr:unnamed protein product [Closterium sp. NIES-64]
MHPHLRCNLTQSPTQLCFLRPFLAPALLCAAPPPSCATIVCPTNSTCNATANPPCICNAGFEMTNGQCVAPPPSCATIVCPTNSTCNATADPPCICNEGLTMTDGQCVGEPPPPHLLPSVLRSLPHPVRSLFTVFLLSVALLSFFLLSLFFLSLFLLAFFLLAVFLLSISLLILLLS